MTLKIFKQRWTERIEHSMYRVDIGIIISKFTSSSQNEFLKHVNKRIPAEQRRAASVCRGSGSELRQTRRRPWARRPAPAGTGTAAPAATRCRAAWGGRGTSCPPTQTCLSVLLDSARVNIYFTHKNISICIDVTFYIDILERMEWMEIDIDYFLF